MLRESPLVSPRTTTWGSFWASCATSCAACFSRSASYVGVSAIIFALINAIGNPIEILLAERPGISTEAIEAMTRYYGLDQPVLTRYGTWLWNIAAAAISAPASCTTSRSARCCRPGAGRR